MFLYSLLAACRFMFEIISWIIIVCVPSVKSVETMSCPGGKSDTSAVKFDEADLKQRLTPLEYSVTQEKDTEQ